MPSGEDVFVLRIQLGNDAMQTGHDVAEALRATADKLDLDNSLSNYYGYVIDANGNNVGQWEVQ